MNNINLEYVFKDEFLLKTAFTHTSYAYERKHGFESNERLEFLGDAVLELVISEYIFNKHNDLPEGEMTKVRASTVCEKTLAEVSYKRNFVDNLIIGKCEKRETISRAMAADLVEAIIGAIYLDGGIVPAKEFILSNLSDYVEESIKGLGFNDYKTILQELLQQNPVCNIKYIVEKEEGPEHDKVFYICLTNNDKEIGRGVGKTKKEAEQQAAKVALESIKNEK